MALSWTLDKLGPMATSADDCGLVMNAMKGADAGDPSSVDRPFGWGGLPDPRLVRRRPFKIAVIQGTTERVQPAVRDNFEKALASYGGLLEVTRDVAWPDFPWGPAVSAIVRAEGATAFLDLIQSGGLAKLTCPRDRWAGYAGLAVSAVDYLQAMRLRGPMKEAVNAMFGKFDAIAAPTRATVAYPIDVTFDKAWPGVGGGPPLIPAGNLCGLPAIALPNGFGEQGLPTSFSFLGPAWSEDTLLTLGALYQSTTTHHAKLPPGVA
jgi:aspartyl-tRNA(Asn)/glutamyl-tRNA(Gln) amidotransferase subunit A